MVDRNKSVNTSIAFEFCNESRVVESMDRFLMNFSIVIWWAGVMRFSSFRTRCRTVRSETISLT